MSVDGTTDDGGYGEEPAVPTEEVPRPTGEVFVSPVPHSALVGLMAEPVARSVPIRRSTVLMLVAFVGFGILTLLYPPAPKAVTTITTTNPSGIIPGLVPATTTTTTHPPTATTTPASTTTTAPSTTTTTTGARPSTTTSTSRPTASTTSTTGPSPSTTTTAVRSTTTSPPSTAAP